MHDILFTRDAFKIIHYLCIFWMHVLCCLFSHRGDVYFAVSQPRFFAIRVFSADDKVSLVDCMLTRLTHWRDGIKMEGAHGTRAPNPLSHPLRLGDWLQKRNQNARGGTTEGARRRAYCTHVWWRRWNVNQPRCSIPRRSDATLPLATSSAMTKRTGNPSYVNLRSSQPTN